uniref:Putative ixodes 26 kDa salivary protein n=1 Tax=Ixodes ricinus TaxID=34613 RepID=A0A0K8R9M1_IXORI
MRTLMGVILFSLLILCLSVKSGPVKRPKKPKNPGNTIITIAYLLDKNDFGNRDESILPEVKEWLERVHGKAQEEIKNATGVSIELQITAINETSEELTRRLEAWVNEGHVYGGWILGFVKTESTNRTANPDITCVLTRHTIYNEWESGMLAYSLHQTLCASMVPMLLTYKADEVDQSGKRLSELIRNSTTSDFKEALKGCNKKKPNSGGKRRLRHSQKEWLPRRHSDTFA